MIILRQKLYSLSEKDITNIIKREFPNVSDKLIFDIEGNIPKNILEKILKDWKNNIIKNIWNYEKNYATKNNLKESDFISGIKLYSVSYDDFEDEIGLTFEASGELEKVYSSDFFWELTFSGINGKIINLLAGD